MTALYIMAKVQLFVMQAGVPLQTPLPEWSYPLLATVLLAGGLGLTSSFFVCVLCRLAPGHLQSSRNHANESRTTAGSR